MSLTSFRFIPLLVLSVIFSGPVLAQVENDDIETRDLLKLNLSDWFWARYELGYEHVIDESTSFQIAVAGIGASENNRNSIYDNIFGNFSDVDVEIEHSGWRLSPEIRRYAWVYGGMPEGVFVSLLGRVENWSLSVDEDIDDLSSLGPNEYQGELDGVFTQFHWGGGVMVGYQWYSDNGISIEMYTGPMFRSFSRSWSADAVLTDGEQELAEDSLEPRVFQTSQWDPYLIANSGPSWRFGLTVGLGL